MKYKKFENLKELVSKKINLESSNQSGTNEYQKNMEQINNTLAGFSKDDITHLKYICNEEYSQYVAFCGSDIGGLQQKKMDEKIDVVLECKKLLNKNSVIKHTDLAPGY